jgi:DNA-binding NarL/FixJ family response regulator
MSVRVVLIDDHPVVRAGPRALLTASDVEVVAEGATVDEAVAAVRETRPDVVLMDLQLADGGDGVTATAAIAALPQPTRVLILTTYDTDADILRAVEAGAAGYLLKDAAPQVLLDGVAAAARGETVVAPQVATRRMARVREPASDLSARELEVIGLVADGLSNRDIARRLFVSEATVKSHLVHVFTKLGVASRTAAVAAARERGLLR